MIKILNISFSVNADILLSLRESPKLSKTYVFYQR